jgi:plasmid maintenance system antidote protein VapI
MIATNFVLMLGVNSSAINPILSGKRGISPRYGEGDRQRIRFTG